ncbi:MAG: hypothetical protein JST59_01460 [Actinobacteria bacterium]|nr:hypothetical protein [Actinomycetota bacterium]
MIKYQLCFEQLMPQEWYSENELFQMFSGAPFFLPEENIDKLVRYLCEDSSEVIGGCRVQSQRMLHTMLKTIVPHCELIQQKRQTILEDWTQVVLC